ncbi:hypothetical protein [Azospirillum halopraeferens]|uniref:hypothetical protein n=1 Tax=Azospirillum halopraeferens TaxID=34010 RepID=UPI0003FB4047|nr:hypothetical protein [Azospirillum halopraeferens]
MRTAVVVQPFLRRVLLADAAACGVMGPVLLLTAQPQAAILGLPPALVGTAGAILLLLAALLAYLGTRSAVSRRVVVALIVGDLLWVVDSIALLLTGWIAPTDAGIAFMIGQAAAVACFAELKIIGLRRATIRPDPVPAE